MTFPSSPDHAAWLSVLSGDLDEAGLRWLLRYVHGWPVLADEPRRSLLWSALARVPEGLWSEELVCEAAGSRGGEGPPTVSDALMLLSLPAASWRVRGVFGFATHFEYFSDHSRARVAASALESLSSSDPVAAVALCVGRGIRTKRDLLAETRALFDYHYRVLVDPAWGGGPARVETFLSLRDGSSQPLPALVAATLDFVPGPPFVLPSSVTRFL